MLHTLRHSIIILALAVAAALGFMPGAFGAQVQLAWDPVTSQDPFVDGYNLYIGAQSGQYDSHIDVGLTTRHLVTGLTDDQDYYFAVTAYGRCTNPEGDELPLVSCESAKSNEVFVTELALEKATDIHYQVAFMANNFENDPNCVALWRLENGALGTDTIGGNNLSNTGVSANTSDYQEGSASGDFERSESDRLSITDALLDSDYPLKSGDTNKKISVCGWFKPESLGVTQYLYAKYDKTNNKRSIALIVTSDSTFQLNQGYNGGASYEGQELTSLTLSTGYWYHWAFTYDDSDRSFRIRCRRDGQSAYELTGTFSNAINVEDAGVYLGSDSEGGSNADGLKDETVVFKDILTADEIDEIYAQTYSLGYTLGADTGSYVLTGQAATLKKDSMIAANGGAYSLSGQPAALLYNRKIVANTGEFILNGQTIGLLHNHTIQAATGALNINGTEVNLLKSFMINADSGTYTLTGADANLLFGRVLSAESGTYILTGMDADLLRSFLLQAETESYILTGSDAALLIDRLIQADSGSYILTGMDADLIYSSGYVITAESGEYILTGTNVALLVDRLITAGPGEYILTGADADLLINRLIQADSGTYTLTGADANLLFGRVLSAESGTYILTGMDADLLRSFLLQAELTEYVLTGFDAILQYSGELLPNGPITISIAVKQPGFSIAIQQPGFSITIKQPKIKIC